MSMKKVLQMKQERAAKVAEARKLHEDIAAENRSYTEDEDKKHAELLAVAERMGKDIEREERMLDLEASTAVVVGEDRSVSQPFNSFGEYLQEIRYNPQSARLQSRAVATMGNGPSLGFMVPEQFDFNVRKLEPQEAVVRPRARVIPAGTPPDSAITLVALDQTGNLGVHSGVTVNWVGELGPRVESDPPKLNQIKLEPNEVSAYINVSDKLLRNAEAAGALVTGLLRDAIISAEESAFIAGDGVGKPLGFLDHAATVKTARATTGQITYADVVTMYSRKLGRNHVWLASSTILPTLMQMRDTAGNMIWQPNARDGVPSTLLGLPLIENERQPALGDAGDLMLVDLSFYGIKDGSPVALFIDPYTQKETATTRVYAWWNVDGGPLLTGPLVREDGVTEASPFVALDE